MDRYKSKFKENNIDWDQLVDKINSQSRLLTTSLYLTHSPQYLLWFL